MINLRRLFGLCDHQWVEIERGRIMIQWDNGPLHDRGVYITYQCRHCLKIKDVRP